MTPDQMNDFARELESWAEQIARDAHALAVQAQIIQQRTEMRLPDGPEGTE